VRVGRMGTGGVLGEDRAVEGIRHLVIPAFTMMRSFSLLSTTTFLPTYFVVTRGRKEEVC